MHEPGGGGRELAWGLWTTVAILFVIFGVAELVGPRHVIPFWLLAGSLLTCCSLLTLGLSWHGRSPRDTLDAAMKDWAQRWIVRITVGTLVGVSVYFAVAFSIPRHTHLPSVALGQPLVYRIEICLAIAYGGLLLLTPLFHGLVRGTLPIEIGQGGAKWPQAANAANTALDELDASVKTLQHDSTDLLSRVVALELAKSVKED